MRNDAHNQCIIIYANPHFFFWNTSIVIARSFVTRTRVSACFVISRMWTYYFSAIAPFFNQLVRCGVTEDEYRTVDPQARLSEDSSLYNEYRFLTIRQWLSPCTGIQKILIYSIAAPLSCWMLIVCIWDRIRA